MANFAGFSVHVISETPRYAVNVTQYPVERGINLTDHVEQQAVTLDVTGKVLGPDAASIRAKLVIMMREGTIVSFTGRNAFKQALITSFESTHDAEVANGFNFSASLVQVRIADSSVPPISDIAVKSQVKILSANGRQQLKDQKKLGESLFHTIRKGQTFSSIASKYGTTWQAIVKLNTGVDPKKLAIGQKVRIS